MNYTATSIKSFVGKKVKIKILNESTSNHCPEFIRDCEDLIFILEKATISYLKHSFVLDIKLYNENTKNKLKYWTYVTRLDKNYNLTECSIHPVDCKTIVI